MKFNIMHILCNIFLPRKLTFYKSISKTQQYKIQESSSTHTNDIVYSSRVNDK